MKDVLFKLGILIVIALMLLLIAADLLILKIKRVKVFKPRTFPKEQFPQIVGDK